LDPTVIIFVDFGAIVIQVGTVLVSDAVGLGIVFDIDLSHMSTDVKRTDNMSRRNFLHLPAEAGASAHDGVSHIGQGVALRAGDCDRSAIDIRVVATLKIN
jgi:hypothetical protein